MTKNERALKNQSKYIGAELEYNLDPVKPVSKHTLDNYELVKDSLKRVGVILDVSGNTLRISVDKDGFVSKHYRNAGKRDKAAVFKTNAAGLAGCKVYYKDYLKMLRCMSDKDIMAEIGMTYATYYRHKKAFLESDYYRNIDKTCLENEEYIEAGDGNTLF